MRYVFDHDYHIHSKISLCSNDEGQTNERILQYAKDNGLKRICLTDHFWDDPIPVKMNFYEAQNYAHIEKALPLPQDENVEFLFGCEIDMNRNNVVGMAPEGYERFSFVIIPTTHFHMVGFTIKDTDAENPKTRAAAWVNRLEAVLNMDLPFHKIGLAHLACPLLAPNRAEYLEVLNLLPEEKLTELFTKAAKLGAGIELNSYDMKFSDEEADTVLRMFRIAKNCGCKFYLGSDIHHPNDFENVKMRFERAIDLLDLTEDDKFHIK